METKNQWDRGISVWNRRSDSWQSGAARFRTRLTRRLSIGLQKCRDPALAFDRAAGVNYFNELNENDMHLELMSHALCPYVQRAVITLREKGIEYERTDIDLSNKPDWFTAISPLGKTPVLRVDGKHIIFESAVICEYLDETQGETRLHPSDPLERASHRSWIEFASAALSDISGLYTSPDALVFDQKRESLRQKIGLVENKLGSGPFFSGADFSLVDAAFAPFFRYFDTLEKYAELEIFAGHTRTSAWRQTLAERPSVTAAVSDDYPERLTQFLVKRESHISALILSAADTILA